MKKILIGSIFIMLTTSSFAENVINTETNTWKSVPIVVDENNHTYSISKGYLMPEGEYYYTYSGFRCLKNKFDKSDVEPIVYNDIDMKGQPIYCYPEK